MFYKPMGLIVFCTFIATLSACSSTTKTQPAATFPVAVTQFEYQFPKQALAVKITYSLSQDAGAVFQLFNGKIKKGHEIVEIGLSNKNCTFGHQFSVNHRQNSNEFYIKYSDKEIPWNTPNTITITRVKPDILHVDVNGETIEAKLAKPVSMLNIRSYLAPIEIHNIEPVLQ